MAVSYTHLTELLNQRDQLADVDFVKVDYAAFAAKNPVKVTTQDLADYIKKHPVMFKTDATRNLGIVFFPAKPSATDDAIALKEINKLYLEGVDNGNGLESFKNTPNDSMSVSYTHLDVYKRQAYKHLFANLFLPFVF